MRALIAEALTARRGNDYPSDFYVALEVCSRSGMDELGLLWCCIDGDVSAWMHTCIKTWEMDGGGVGEGRS